MPADINLLSFLGPTDNGRAVDLRGQSIGSESGLDAAGAKYASPLKFTSMLEGLELKAGKVWGGHDACVDCNNLVRDLDLVVDELHPTGQFAATIKGGAARVRLAGNLMAHGSVCDVIYGDWSDQSHKYTEGCTLGITSGIGPVTVIVLAGTKPELEPGTGPYRFLFPSPDMIGHNLVVWGFETLRRWGFWRSESNA
jgi:hypothetical protein